MTWYRSNQIHFLQRDTFANPSDYALYRFLVSSVIRHKTRYLTIIEGLTQRRIEKIDLEALICLMLGLSQLEPGMKIREYAAVNETVELLIELKKPFLKGFVNANLRSFLRNKESLLEGCPQRVEIETSHPKWMVKRWRTQYGDSDTTKICQGNNVFPKLNIVINPKYPKESVLADLITHDIEIIDEGKNGLSISSPVGIFDTDSSKSGSFLIQDLSSQDLIRMINPLQKKRVLDACAAPGGKLFHLEWAYGSDIEHLVAADVSAARMHRLVENKKRYSSRSDIVMMDAKNPALKPGFDLVLVDAPCSSTGTIQKHPEIKWNRRLEDFYSNHNNQLEIVDRLSCLVNERGCLLYITCSLEKEENQMVVDEFLKHNSKDFSLLPFQELTDSPSLISKEGYYISLPDTHRMGMFAALLQKK